MTDADAYRDFVSARLDRLRRTGYLLCGDWHTADDLVSAALIKLYRHWRRVSTMDNLDGYLHRVLVRVWLDERRRPWRRELPYAVPPDAAAAGVATDERLALLAHLAELPPRRRAVLVLRFFLDLSVEQTAEAMGCSTGTVKSQTARALDAMRARLIPAGEPEEARWTS
ncbi:SigE family RNA polymerase sigma factor [Rugosimonospora africana]|uniref:RNA polymerase sigma24 factor n=1 Tax=Rugosimonospora africana TaxID=556532 RepID=A0A8J3QQJ2_9ACTN|nr:SigE family RNA polymerase sigma factor [Rugosimonospora africana]GIH13341.1 RNA polymerase sigma24 factor [Rugosimonospora africana]